MRVELVRPTHPDDEWRIAVNGLNVVAFAGPGAAARAAECFEELNDRLFRSQDATHTAEDPPPRRTRL